MQTAKEWLCGVILPCQELIGYTNPTFKPAATKKEQGMNIKPILGSVLLLMCVCVASAQEGDLGHTDDRYGNAPYTLEITIR